VVDPEVRDSMREGGLQTLVVKAGVDAALCVHVKIASVVKLGMTMTKAVHEQETAVIELGVAVAAVVHEKCGR